MKITAIVIVYNKSCSESISLQSIEKYGDGIDVIVFDNSTTNYNNREYCEKNGYQYFTEGKNLGLSKAYNYSIRQAKSDFIILLDDDTELNERYFREAKKAINESAYEIILPIVKANDIIISPSIVQFGCRVKKIKDVKDIDKKRITAINSGMVVKKSVYNKIKYDEKVFLDYLDHDFMRRVRKNNLNIKVMPEAVIRQNFSMMEKKDLEAKKRRFQIYKRDFKIYCKKAHCLIYYYINIWQYKRRLKKMYGVK